MADGSTAGQTNGISDGTASKRKHESESHSMATAPSPTIGQQSDLLEVLKRYSSVTLLDQEFNEQTNEPKSKRTKLSASATRATSIAQKLENGRYSRWTDLAGDIEIAKDRMCQEARAEDTETDGRPSITKLKQIQHISAAASSMVELVTSEAISRSEGDNTVIKEEQINLPNGLDKTVHEDKSGIVLTLFGNAPTPKQLFSSLQARSSHGQPAVVKDELHVEELSLPNGLSATKIKASVPPTQKGPTFAESFPSPFALPQLTPPKASKRSTTKDNVLKWELKAAPTKSSKRGGFSTQKLCVADWLSYGDVDSRHDSLSPLEKRQQRDRALSSSKSSDVAPRSATGLAAELEKQEEALFQRAYSSFAPAYDNSRSLVDASVKSMIWWNKIGNRQFDARFAGEYSLGVTAPSRSTAPDVSSSDVQEQDLAEAVEAYSEQDGNADDENGTIDLTDIDIVLKKIADLLQTLASYQWIRSSAQPSSSSPRPLITPTHNVSGTATRPDEPSTEETEVYEEVRHEIAYLVLQLPPYAVAKIDGKQLAQLGVSELITYSSPNYRGQLEEDQVARVSRYTAAATAASVAALTRSSAISNPHYSSSSRTPAIGQSANTRYGQSGSYPARSSMPTSAQRTTSTYGTPTAPARAQYSQPGQYARPPASQQMSSFGQTSQYRQSSGYGNYGSSYGSSTPQTQPRAATYHTPFQQQSQTAATNAVSQGYNGITSQTKPTTGLQFAQQLQQGGAITGNHASPSQTPVSGLQQTRAAVPLEPRNDTPQPPAPMGAAQAVNGHA